MVEVRVICAIGKHGQLGLNGRLPWEGRGNSIFRDDIQRFFALTRGHVLIAGPRTISSLPDWARSERTFLEIRSADEPDAILKSLSRPGRVRWRRPARLERLRSLRSTLGCHASSLRR